LHGPPASAPSEKSWARLGLARDRLKVRMPRLDHFRAFPRQAIKLEVSVSAAGDWLAGAQIRDLSLAGACLELREGLQAGDVLGLAISIPTLWDPLQLAAVTSWVGATSLPQGVRMGVRFTEVDGPTLRTLMQLLETAAAPI